MAQGPPTPSPDRSESRRQFGFSPTRKGPASVQQPRALRRAHGRKPEENSDPHPCRSESRHDPCLIVSHGFDAPRLKNPAVIRIGIVPRGHVVQHLKVGVIEQVPPLPHGMEAEGQLPVDLCATSFETLFEASGPKEVASE